MEAHFVRYYTPEEANALLPTVTAAVEGLQDVTRRLQTALQAVHAFERRAISNGHSSAVPPFPPEQDVAAIQAEMRERLDYFAVLGIEIKDIEHGVLDFPAHLDGREIFLCWQLGERAVAHWHEIDAGYAGRRPL